MDRFWRLRADSPVWLRAAYSAAILLLLSVGFYFAFAQIAYHWNWRGVWNYRARFVSGWFTTLGISALSLVLSTAIGLLAALARRSSVLLLRQSALIYVELIRGTPLLVQILIFFYIVANAMGLHSRFLAGVLILSLFAGAYISEIIRSGIESVGASQRESARAIGLTAAQTYRHVIFPQAFRQMLPPLSGQFVSLVKDSSLLSIIAINEFTLSAQQVNSYTYSALESYLPLAIGYLIVTLPLSWLSRSLEKRFRYET
ncbi:MAG: amino acid ABC transporter permease [Kiritimatiellae bacterium]|nr:amino acid ABC transporter permease [Kiritimatiellia bacterium]MCO6401073.1 amino acid ABC transporter permease [Verrucomicrobiota bacterium]